MGKRAKSQKNQKMNLMGDDLITRKEKQITKSRGRMNISQAQHEPDSGVEQMEVENENTDQVTEYINKLFTKNKVSHKNAFLLPIIDLHHIEFGEQFQGDVWKKLSCTLENDYKIYGYRVDSLSDLLGKISAYLLRHSHEQQKSGKQPEDDKEQNEVEKVIKKSICEIDRFLEKNLYNITILIELKMLKTNPLFDRACRLFQQRGLECYLLNTLSINSNFELSLSHQISEKPFHSIDPCEQFYDQQAQSEDPKPESVDPILKLKDQISEISYSPSFSQKILKKKKRLYDFFGLHLDSDQTNYDRIWKKIQQKNFDSAFNIDLLPDSEQEAHIQHPFSQAEVSSNQKDVQFQNNEEILDENRSIDPVSSIRNENNQTEQLNLQNYVSIPRRIEEVIRMRSDNQKKSTRKKALNENVKQVIQREREKKQKPKYYENQQNQLMFDPSFKENQKKIFKPAKKKTEKIEEKEIQQKKLLFQKPHQFTRIIQKLSFTPWSSLIPYSYEKRKYPEKQKMVKQGSSSEEESDQSQEKTFERKPTIRQIKEKIAEIIKNEEVRDFKSILSLYNKQEKPIKSILCYIALLHLANEWEFQFESIDRRNFKIKGI